MRRASRVDANHRELIDAARKLGAIVIETFAVGGGCPDAFVWSLKTGWFAVEIKTLTGKFKPSQLALQQVCPVTIWRTSDDVLRSLTKPHDRPARRAEPHVLGQGAERPKPALAAPAARGASVKESSH